MALTVSKSYYGSQSFNDVIRPFFVIALSSKLSKENELEFVEAALGRTVKQVITSCKNTQVTSYIVPVELSYDIWMKIKKLASKFDQNSYFFVDDDRTTYLCSLDSIPYAFRIGKFQRIYASEAIESGNWTLDNNQFWGIK